ncbi:MAG: Smr/MutS family protein [Myxococcota bacterium]
MAKKTPFNASLADAAKALKVKLEAEAQEKQKAEIAKKAPKPRPKQEAPEEELSFAEHMRGTQPIRGDTRGQHRAPPPPDHAGYLALETEEAEVLANLASLVDGTGTFDISDSDEFIEGAVEGLDRRILRNLRRGDYAVEAHVDLHGLTKEPAKDAVESFIAESRRRGQRCVLIVHGRGLNSKDQIPVLKLALKAWLERGRIARNILAFSTARPHDGGAGAVYVLLRRG